MMFVLARLFYGRYLCVIVRFTNQEPVLGREVGKL